MQRLARDEYLDVTALATDDVETLALSSTARSPVRVTLEVPRDEVDELALLLDRRAAADRDTPAGARARAGLAPGVIVSAVLDYCTAGARVAERALVQRPRLGREERLVFVVGCPRSGTTFVGRAIGGLPGFVDFGEVTPWKAALPQNPSAADLRRILERIRRLGLAWGLRGVEQTPETAHVLDAALEAYPQALAVHVVRDGRDVVCSLLERGLAERGPGREGRREAPLRLRSALLGRARAARGVRAGERCPSLRVGLETLRRVRSDRRRRRPSTRDPLRGARGRGRRARGGSSART